MTVETQEPRLRDRAVRHVIATIWHCFGVASVSNEDKQLTAISQEHHSP